MSKPVKSHPPHLPDRILQWFCAEEVLETLQGDLYELYQKRREKKGKLLADLHYAFDVLSACRSFAFRRNSSRSNSNYTTMLQHYFKISWRSLLKNKGYSFINIGGLAMGMTVTMLISLWIYDELSFDKYHKNYDRIAWVMQNQTFSGGEIQTWQAQAAQLAPELRNSYGASFKHIAMTSFAQDFTLLYNEKALTKTGIFMEPEAPEILTLNMLSGTRTGLTDPSSILLSESTAKAFFGNEDPINKIIKIDDLPEVKVTGVYEDLPQNSSFGNLNFIASWETFARTLPEWVSWGNSWFQTLVQIAGHAEMNRVSSVIKDAKLNRVSEDEGARYKPELFLHPMSKWHLYSEFKQGQNVGGRIQYVWLFGMTGVFVLMLACINFMNLSTARSEKRAKEIGVRKAMGSARSQLIFQFFIESIFVAVFAFIASLFGVQLILPYFNEVAGKQISILWSNPMFWLLGASFALLTGILAGSYPALYLSSFRAVNVLKGIFRAGRMAAIPRKALVVVQFTVSVTLIIGTIIVFQQIEFVKNRPVGYNQSHLVTVPIKNDAINKHYEVFRNDLLQTGAVEEVSKSESPITQTFITNGGLHWKGKEPGMQDQFVTIRITHDFGKTIGWEINEGRDFSREFKTDSLGFIINESAARYMGFDNPVGEKVRWGKETYTIIGVVKDMVTQSPYSPVKQTFFFINYERTNLANIRIKPNTSVNEAIAKIEAVFKSHDPVSPFEYSLVDQEYAKNFGNEVRIGKLASFFAILAIFISCLGLFGLASYVAGQRTKEIGIRKVLGASVANLWHLLSKDFVVLVFISCFVAMPLAWYFMSSWLESYVYRTEISWYVFAVTGIGALLITLCTVSFQAIKAATANPVNSLRTE